MFARMRNYYMVSYSSKVEFSKKNAFTNFFPMHLWFSGGAFSLSQPKSPIRKRPPRSQQVPRNPSKTSQDLERLNKPKDPYNPQKPRFLNLAKLKKATPTPLQTWKSTSPQHKTPPNLREKTVADRVVGGAQKVKQTDCS